MLTELRKLDESRWFEVVDFIGYLQERGVAVNGNGAGENGTNDSRVENSETAQEDSRKKPYTLGDLRNSEFVGSWKDRDDIDDSVEYARALRRRAETRPHIWER